MDIKVISEAARYPLETEDGDSVQLAEEVPCRVPKYPFLTSARSNEQRKQPIVYDLNSPLPLNLFVLISPLFSQALLHSWVSKQTSIYSTSRVSGLVSQELHCAVCMYFSRVRIL